MLVLDSAKYPGGNFLQKIDSTLSRSLCKKPQPRYPVVLNAPLILTCDFASATLLSENVFCH